MMVDEVLVTDHRRGGREDNRSCSGLAALLLDGSACSGASALLGSGGRALGNGGGDGRVGRSLLGSAQVVGCLTGIIFQLGVGGTKGVQIGCEHGVALLNGSERCLNSGKLLSKVCQLVAQLLVASIAMCCHDK